MIEYYWTFTTKVARCLPGAMLLLLGATGALAEEGNAPLTAFLERLEVRVVNVEVFVTDRRGNPLPDLGREDFEIFEDGKRVELAHFLPPRTQGSPLQNPPRSPVSQRGAPPPSRAIDQGSETPASPTAVEPTESGHHIVLFVDNLNIAPHSRKRVLDRLREIVRAEGGLGASFLVATYDGRVKVRQGFTDDMARVETALEGLDRLAGPALARQNERLALLREGQQVLQTLSVANANVGSPETFNTMKDLAESQVTTLVHQVERYGQRMHAETRRGVAALGNFVSALAARPGRKAVVYVSDGVEMRPGEELFYAMEEIFQGGQKLHVEIPGDSGGGGQGGGVGQGQQTGGGGGNLQSEEMVNMVSFVTRAERFSLTKVYQELTALANTHQVSFYTVDARAGLGGAGADASLSGTIGRLESGGGLRAVRDANRWETLGVMAEETGGLLLTGADVEGLLTRVSADFGSHYSLGYVPPHPGDGKPHQIRVKVKKRGGRLRYRQSYIAQSLTARLADRTVGTLLLEDEANPHGMTLETLEPTAGEKRGEFVVPLLVHIPLRNVTLLPQGAAHACRARLFITVRGADGSAGPVQEVPFQIEIPNEELGLAVGQNYSARVDLVVRSGRTGIAVGLMDDTGGEGSFVRHEVVVGAS